MRRLVVLLALVVASLAALVPLTSCGKLKGALRPNTPPTTRIFVSGPVDTVNHVVHLYWFGSDVDGHVVGYEIRLLNPARPADSAWVYTTRTDSAFTIFTPAGYTAPVFQVRAIDNLGARDPNPAVQSFQFKNVPPIVTFTTYPLATDTTLLSVTVTYRINDVDGDPNKAVYQFCFDDSTLLRNNVVDSVVTTTASTFTIPTHRFMRANAVDPSDSIGVTRRRTLYVRAIDDGGMAGPIVGVNWIVKRPVPGKRARLLIVDDVPSTNPANTFIDSLYLNVVKRTLDPLDVAAGKGTSYNVLRIEKYPTVFRSPQDVAQTCALYESVIWYRNNETGITGQLQANYTGLGTYLENGTYASGLDHKPGALYLDGLYLFSGINANGLIDPSFASKYLGCGFLSDSTSAQTFGNGLSIGYSNPNNARFATLTLPNLVTGVAERDSIKLPQLAGRTGEAGGFRCFDVQDSSKALFFAVDSTSLLPANKLKRFRALGVSVPQPSGSRAIVSSIPLGTAIPRNGSGNFRVLQKILTVMGLTTP